MAIKTNLIATLKTANDKTKTANITNVNPDAADSSLATFASSLFSLSQNSLVDVSVAEKRSLDMPDPTPDPDPEDGPRNDDVFIDGDKFSITIDDAECELPVDGTWPLEQLPNEFRIDYINRTESAFYIDDAVYPLFTMFVTDNFNNPDVDNDELRGEIDDTGEEDIPWESNEVEPIPNKGWSVEGNFNWEQPDEEGNHTWAQNNLEIGDTLNVWMRILYEGKLFTCKIFDNVELI